MKGKMIMSRQTPMKTLLRLACEQPAVLSPVPLTPLLQAYAGVPLHEHVLSQRLHRLAAAVPELVLDQGEPIFERQAMLQESGGISYLYSEILIVPSAIPLLLYTRLLQEEPLEAIIQQLRLPTFREVIASGRASLAEIAEQKVAAAFGMEGGAEVLYRTSLFFVHERPHCATMRLTEMLPVAYVDEPQDASLCQPSWTARAS
jgi:chorismate-pyruvate lyase